jgi:hypothetical protein
MKKSEEPAYTVEVLFADKSVEVLKDVVFDGYDAEKPNFYGFHFKNRTSRLFSVEKIFSLAYGEDKAAYMDYWRNREKAGFSKE